MTALVVDGVIIAPRGARPAVGVSFYGCTTNESSVCACETWRPVWCRVCDADIEDGDLIIERRYLDPAVPGGWNGRFTTDDILTVVVHAACHPGYLRRLHQHTRRRHLARKRRRRA